jgi:hypothetical protein
MLYKWQSSKLHQYINYILFIKYKESKIPWNVKISFGHAHYDVYAHILEWNSFTCMSYHLLEKCRTQGWFSDDLHRIGAEWSPHGLPVNSAVTMKSGCVHLSTTRITYVP